MIILLNLTSASVTLLPSMLLPTSAFLDPMASPSPLLKLGQNLTGRLSTYTVAKQLGEFIWLGRYTLIIHPRSHVVLICIPFNNSNQVGESVIIKSARHFRISNERDVLRKFQSNTPHLRPLVDDIIEPQDPPAIVLKHLEDDLQSASAARKLSKREIKYVSRSVLQALNVLHEDGYVHTGQHYTLDKRRIFTY